MILFHGTSETSGNQIIRNKALKIDQCFSNWGTHNRGSNPPKCIFLTPSIAVAIRYGADCPKLHRVVIPFYVFRLKVNTDQLLPDDEEFLDVRRFNSKFNTLKLNMTTSLNVLKSVKCTHDINLDSTTSYLHFTNNPLTNSVYSITLCDQIASLASHRNQSWEDFLQLTAYTNKLINLQQTSILLPNPWKNLQ